MSKTKKAILGVVAVLVGWVGTSFVLAYRESRKDDAR